MIKRPTAVLACCFAAAFIFLVAFCRPKPDGGFYWTFITYWPVITSGDGKSFQTAYILRKAHAGGLATVECGLIHEKFGVEDNVMTFTNASLDGRAFDIISFPSSSGTNTVYFDITYYRQKGER